MSSPLTILHLAVLAFGHLVVAEPWATVVVVLAGGLTVVSLEAGRR